MQNLFLNLFKRFRKASYSKKTNSPMGMLRYLDERYCTKPDAIEMLFCVPFENLPRILTIPQDNAKILVCISNWQNITLAPFQVLLLDAMHTRISEYLSIDIDDEALVFLSLVCENFAIAMMYLTYIQYWAKKNDRFHVTFEHVSGRIFHHGFPKEAALKELWYSLKVNHPSGSDNLIDYEGAQQSIQIK